MKPDSELTPAEMRRIIDALHDQMDAEYRLKHGLDEEETE
jgi:hypothetical protein